MSVPRAILLGTCFWGLLAAGVVLLWRGGSDTGQREPAAPTSAGDEDTTCPPESEPLTAGWRAESAPAAQPPDEGPVARYPDGSSARLLNGVTEPMVVTWPDRVPFTPIVGTYRDGPPNHWEWYVHEDGTQSTVAMFRLQPGAEPVPTSLVRHPRAIGAVRATGDGRFVPVR